MALSTRERIEKMTKQGLSVREIALALHITTQAVYKHLKRIEAEKQEGAA